MKDVDVGVREGCPGTALFLTDSQRPLPSTREGDSSRRLCVRAVFF